MYAHGLGVEQDYDVALTLLEEGVSKGESAAFNTLGFL
jgi:TPR repeat protein